MADSAPSLTAPFWRRLAAMLYDALALVGIWFVAAGIWVGFRHGEAVPADSPLFTSYLVLLAYGYFAACWRRGGQTLGMKSWRLRVVDAHSLQRLSWRQTLLRFVVGVVSWLPAGFGYWWALTDPERRGWPDRASGTRLIKVKYVPD